MRILHEIDACRVNVVVGGIDICEFARHAVEGALPEISGEGQHVRLVHQGDVPALTGGRQLEGVTHATLHPHPRVDRPLGGHFGRGAAPEHPALTHIGPFSVFTDHYELVRCVMAGGGSHEGTLVHIQIEFEPHLQ